MQYLVLRDCFVDRFFAKGTTVDLPDDFHKSPKNFQPVGSEDIQEIPTDEAKWVNPSLETAEAPPAPSSEPTDDATQEPPLYVSPNPKKPKKKRRKVKIGN